MQIGSFGEVVFEVSSNAIWVIPSFSLEGEARYEDHQVQGNFEVPEFLAPSLVSGSLSIILRRDLGVEPMDEATKLYNMMAEGEVAPLVIAHVNQGDYTLRKVSQTWTLASKAKQGPDRIDLNLEFKQYY